MIHCDGSGWNGEESKICVYPESDDWFIDVFKEKHTNNEMEYKAMLRSMKIAHKEEEIKTDSQLVVKQLKGEYSLNANNLKKYYKECKKLMVEKNLDIFWINREKNKAGKILEGVLNGE